jgi:hypothetical protein
MESVEALVAQHDRLQGVILKYEGILDNLERLVELKVRYFKCHIILKITILDEQDPHWNEIEI